MKKKMAIVLAGLAISLMGKAQISASDFTIGAAGNYSMYKGDLKKSTPGFKLEVGYRLKEKLGFTLGFTKGLPIKEASSIEYYDELGNTKTVASSVQLNFSTISFSALYRFIGDEETAVNVYAPIGASYVMANLKEKASEAPTSGYTAADQTEATKANGFTINLGLGIGYNIGLPQIFAEGGIALPANKVNNSYVSNPIPANFTINAGLRIPLGRSDNY